MARIQDLDGQNRVPAPNDDGTFMQQVQQRMLLPANVNISRYVRNGLVMEIVARRPRNIMSMSLTAHEGQNRFMVLIYRPYFIVALPELIRSLVNNRQTFDVFVNGQSLDVFAFVTNREEGRTFLTIVCYVDAYAFNAASSYMLRIVQSVTNALTLIPLVLLNVEIETQTADGVQSAIVNLNL